jgi:hypothetical protein
MGTSFASACLSAILAAAWSADSSGAAELLALMVTVGYADLTSAPSDARLVRCSASRLITNCSRGFAVNFARTRRP